MEETREKIELFRNYYFVCFRGFDQDPYSPTHLEPLNMYIIVFREGTLSVSIVFPANHLPIKCAHVRDFALVPSQINATFRKCTTTYQTAQRLH